MAEIGGDAGSAEWKSSRQAARGKVKAAWLAGAIARAESKRKALTAENAEKNSGKSAKRLLEVSLKRRALRSCMKRPGTAHRSGAASKSRAKKSSANSAASAMKVLAGAEQKPMPTVIHPMLATSTPMAFDNPTGSSRLNGDGYRAVAFIEEGHVRLVSRTQNDLTAQFVELGRLPQFRESAARHPRRRKLSRSTTRGFLHSSLMQQRTGFQPGKGRLPRLGYLPGQGASVVYYAFDLLYLDGFDLRRVTLEQRKQLLQERIVAGDVRTFPTTTSRKGLDLFEAAKQRELEGIVAKKRSSIY